jgi:DnaK suppressor protein
MTPRQRDRLAKLLQKLRADALGAGPHKLEAKEGKDEDAEALTEMLQAISSSRNKGQAELIARIDRALVKLRDAPDDYGLCEECEEEIPLKRLELMPHATLCAECQGKADPRRGLVRRKITDYSE